MKKPMTALAAVAVAAVAQAASVDWGIANRAWTLNDGSKATAGYTVYLINGATALDTIAAAIDAKTGAFSTDQDWVLDSSVTVNKKGSTAETTATNARTYDATSAANGWAAVPEPTSGLPLLLGMAGLALKRKRA